LLGPGDNFREMTVALISRQPAHKQFAHDLGCGQSVLAGERFDLAENRIRETSSHINSKVRTLILFSGSFRHCGATSSNFIHQAPFKVVFTEPVVLALALD